MTTVFTQPLRLVFRALEGARVSKVVTAWAARQQTRGALKRLDPHLLRDIGLNQNDAHAECAKPFWRD
ncbi:DUF1127 domain-containing protein [Neogemmobacter tilapiae]|uniref:YjiS-like domain-containing protein n=1 Tax=Neogemmobacter tilapiae TaxID=875041 RepID=A0A918TFF2_9RHOB|nr:DUF1127 domain-containing protein [Gemmobacter tilapiae]GHC43746.1 hypothetical protein GCM10007315_01020 [Gemmobacter tilapiae]